MSAEQRTILFLHGALGTSAELQPVMSLMSENGFRTLTFNFSGHGKGSLSPEQFRIEHFAQDLDKYIREHQLHDLTVFGHSMGGYTALFHKAHYENSPISTIFTYGTKFNWSESTVAKELPMLDPVHLQEKFPQYVDVLKQKHGEDRWKPLLLSTAHMIQNLERLDGLTREDLEDVEEPVILMLGDQDRMVTSEETHLTASWIKGAQVKIISHSKHDFDRANHREIASVMQEFII